MSAQQRNQALTTARMMRWFNGLTFEQKMRLPRHVVNRIVRELRWPTARQRSAPITHLLVTARRTGVLSCTVRYARRTASSGRHAKAADADDDGGGDSAGHQQPTTKRRAQPGRGFCFAPPPAPARAS